MPLAIEKLRIVSMNTLRRPNRSASLPQIAEPRTAPMPEDIKMIADCPPVRCQGAMMNASTKEIRK